MIRSVAIGFVVVAAFANIAIADQKSAEVAEKTVRKTFALSEQRDASAIVREQAALVDAVKATDLFAELSAEQNTVEVDGQTYTVVEGDRLLDPDELILYTEVRRQAEELNRSSQYLLGTTPLIREQGLLGITTSSGRLVRWDPTTELTYCVLKNTFRNQSEYEEVVDDFAEAASDWENLCGVDFRYVPEFDNSPNVTPPTGIVFVVRGINARGRFIASAFFPNDPPVRRRVLVDPSYFTTSFDKVGVFRHEIGHILGFRHEHIRLGASWACRDRDGDGVPDESTADTSPLTAYDSRSVMHYFCPGGGSRELDFTELDGEGARSLYGPPFSGVDFVEP